MLGTAVEVGLTPKSGDTAGVRMPAPERVLLWIWQRGELAMEIGWTS